MTDEWFARCDCGWSDHGPEQELIRRIQDHAREAHGLEISREQAFAQARPVDPRSASSSSSAE